VAKRFPEAEGGINSHNLKIRLEEKQLLFNVEKVIVPEKPFLVSLQYKNTTNAFFKVIRVTEQLRTLGLREGQARLLAELAKAPVVKAWEQPLPDTKDFQLHRTETDGQPLPVGAYYLVVSTHSGFNNPGEATSFSVFYVSNISFVNQGRDYFVLDRDTGAPLKKVKVQTWKQKYSNALSRYIKEKGPGYETDENGHFRLGSNSGNERNNFFFEFSSEKDHLMIDELQYSFAGERIPENRDEETMFFFTDRSIYRPGQTLYFKGILLNRKKGESRSEVVTGRTTTVQLLDANGQKIDSLALSTNEFGSLSGTFQLPQGGLNGLFQVVAAGVGGSSQFRVEEYKRPKYKVEIEKPKLAFKLNDTITVTGHAKAFSGSNIDGAKVRYRVERVARFPYPWRFSRGWWPSSSSMQIAHGEVVTDDEGKFPIRFSAIPDRTVSEDTDPVFDYVVYADVTDGSGETRSARQTVSVAYKSMILKTFVPEKLEKSDTIGLRVQTENMNGAFIQSEVTLNVRKLAPEQRLIKERVWERPDQFVLSREKFLRLFPNDEYDRELDTESWEKGAVVLTESRVVAANGNWATAGLKDLSPGFYELEFVAKGDNERYSENRGSRFVR
jgi:uncharacterized protein YfaS (alpha-2-macroglobulin family)